jgi:hypothetical protein
VTDRIFGNYHSINDKWYLENSTVGLQNRKSTWKMLMGEKTRFTTWEAELKQKLVNDSDTPGRRKEHLLTTTNTLLLFKLSKGMWSDQNLSHFPSF